MKKKILTLIAVTTMVVTVSASSAFSVETEKRANYAVGGVGIFTPTNGLDDAGYGSGINTSVAYGRYLTPNLILEGMVDYFRTKSETSGVDTAIGSYSRDDIIGTTGLLVTLKGELPLGPVDLFGGAGVGLYGSFFNSKVDSERYGTSYDNNDFDSTFGAHVSLGGNYNITEMLFVGIEGRYRWTGEVDMKDSSGGGIPVAYSSDLNGYTVAATFGFRF